MTEEKFVEKESELPLFADLDRFANLLNEAQSLSKQNSNYNPDTFRQYFIVLKELQRFLYPLFKTNEKMVGLIKDINALDTITRVAYNRLLTDKSYKVSSKIFEVLSELHSDILVLKQDAALGIRVKERTTPRKRLENVLE